MSDRLIVQSKLLPTPGPHQDTFEGPFWAPSSCGRQDNEKTGRGFDQRILISIRLHQVPQAYSTLIVAPTSTVVTLCGPPCSLYLPPSVFSSAFRPLSLHWLCYIADDLHSYYFTRR